ncbi:MAG: anthranilate phosphoribosyltransferase [Actinobacteria bacterium RBG_16_64_13]|nr:MAG: anthranilate phosphoribosyltransferase [Actinobacteria bacterium RBG_16_64_13]
MTPGAERAPSFTETLQCLAEARDLTRAQAAWALWQIVDGTAGDAEAAAFLMGLRVKGETAEEIAGLLEPMRRLAIPVETPCQDALVDLVGTGGDGLDTFNISTTAAFVVAGAGVKVAKHGNRAATSRCGSADVMEALGVRIDLTPLEVAACIDRVGIGFMLASLHHPAAGKVAHVRRALGVRTVFNFLGPLANPAGVRRQLLGVCAPEYLGVLAGVLARVGCEHALVVCGHGGMDELSVSGPSAVVEVRAGEVGEAYTLEPESCGLALHELASLRGGDPAENAAITRQVLGGAGGGPRDAVLLNAGAGLYVAGAVPSIAQGVERAAASIDSGRAARALDALVAMSSQLAEARR